MSTGPVSPDRVTGNNSTRARAVEWLRGGRRVVLGTLIDCQGSSPFQPGAEILFDDAGRIEGSVTGGCIEAALAQEATEILEGDQPAIRRYGISDESTASVGLMCGGTVSVFLQDRKSVV